MHTALTIAGSDSGGGAGIQADLKTFEAHGVFGTSAITALTAQNTQGVEAVLPVATDMVQAQIKAIISDFTIGAAKTGMLFDEAIISVVANELQGVTFPLVVDPVSVSTSGHSLLKPEAVSALKEQILPLATVITPNIPEAELLTGLKITSREAMITAAEQLAEDYPGVSILLKGFHLTETETELDQISDLLLTNNDSDSFEIHWFTASRIDTPNTHGTGCTLSAAIAANLALGHSLKTAVAFAKTFTHQAIQHSWANLGKGRGTLRHNFNSIVPS